MRFIWWCLMYYHHYALYYDLSCQCAVQCTVILILLPVDRNVVHTFGSPLWWWWWWCCYGWQWWWWWCSLIDCLGKCLEVTKKELHRDSSIFEWLKSRKPWMKSKKIKKWDYPIGTIQTQIENFRHIECWKIAIIGGHQLLLSSEQTKTFCVENFLLKGNISFEIVIKFCRKRTQISFFLLMYICQEVERKVIITIIALWRGNV